MRLFGPSKISRFSPTSPHTKPLTSLLVGVGRPPLSPPRRVWRSAQPRLRRTVSTTGELDNATRLCYILIVKTKYLDIIIYAVILAVAVILATFFILAFANC